MKNILKLIVIINQIKKGELLWIILLLSKKKIKARLVVDEIISIFLIILRVFNIYFLNITLVIIVLIYIKQSFNSVN